MFEGMLGGPMLSGIVELRRARFTIRRAGVRKITIEVTDDLYRQAKVEAARRGRTLKDLIAEGLRLVLETTHRTHRRPSLSALMKGARGAVDSGIPDLASNPEHLNGFGRDKRRNR